MPKPVVPIKKKPPSLKIPDLDIKNDKAKIECSSPTRKRDPTDIPAKEEVP
jgi:hypothetical protein